MSSKDDLNLFAACGRPGQPLAALPPCGCRVPLAGKALRGFFDKPSNRMLFPTVRKDNIYYEKVTGQKHRPAGDARGQEPPIAARSRARVKFLKDAWVLIEDGVIASVGTGAVPALSRARRVVDAEGHLVTPGLVDAHTHLIFGGWRQNELGHQAPRRKTYLDIQNAGGGIQSTTQRHPSRQASEELSRQGLQGARRDDGLRHHHGRGQERLRPCHRA